MGRTIWGDPVAAHNFFDERAQSLYLDWPAAHGDKMSHYRLFLLPGQPVPTCDKHPARKMVRQENKPYNVRLNGKRPT